MPSILFVHENYPAQFGALAEFLAAKGWQVVFATARQEFPLGRTTRVQSIDIVRYQRARDVGSCHRYLEPTETAILNGQAFAKTAAALAKGGFNPDIVVAHSGWGSGSFARVVWPKARFVQYLEWWYRYPYVDCAPEPTNVPPEDQCARALARNLPFLMDFQQADLVIAPTQFQAKQAPTFVRDKMVVCHDGVDCTKFRPLQPEEDPLPLAGVPADAPIVTFATRGMEPLRGFPTFMAAMSEVQKQHKSVHIVVAGRDRVHYGKRLPKGSSYKQKALAQHQFDRDRLHFVDLLPKADYARLLRRSAAHIYLTRPFVLSWSLIEAMASGCPLVVTEVDPVREALPSDDLARFVPIDDADRVAEAALKLLSDPEFARNMGHAARLQAAKTYDSQLRHTEIMGHFSKLITQST